MNVFLLRVTAYSVDLTSARYQHGGACAGTLDCRPVTALIVWNNSECFKSGTHFVDDPVNLVGSGI